MSASGLILIDKPLGITSRQVTTRISKIFSEKRAGHLGTLDPLATGLLPILLGPATRLASFLEHDDRIYRAKIRLGSATNTMDAEGETVFSGPIPEMTRAEMLAVLEKFTGELDQVPPMHSALKHEGQRLYELARKGQEVERKARKVKIFALELENLSRDEMEIKAHCGPGTYIRVLADDLGKTLKCGAYLMALRRLRSGKFGIEQSVPLEQLDPENARGHLIPLEEILDFEKLEVADEPGYKIKDGRSLLLKDLGLEKPAATRLRFFSKPCFAIAEVVEKDGELFLKPLKVFAREPGQPG